jgi:hypothetical protein
MSIASSARFCSVGAPRPALPVPPRPAASRGRPMRTTSQRAVRAPSTRSRKCRSPARPHAPRRARPQPTAPACHPRCTPALVQCTAPPRADRGARGGGAAAPLASGRVPIVQALRATRLRQVAVLRRPDGAPRALLLASQGSRPRHAQAPHVRASGGAVVSPRGAPTRASRRRGQLRRAPARRAPRAPLARLTRRTWRGQGCRNWAVSPTRGGKKGRGLPVSPGGNKLSPGGTSPRAMQLPVASQSPGPRGAARGPAGSAAPLALHSPRTLPPSPSDRTPAFRASPRFSPRGAGSPRAYPRPPGASGAHAPSGTPSPRALRAPTGSARPPRVPRLSLDGARRIPDSPPRSPGKAYARARGGREGGTTGEGERRGAARADGADRRVPRLCKAHRGVLAQRSPSSPRHSPGSCFRSRPPRARVCPASRARRA